MLGTAALFLGGAGLAACGNAGASLAKQACTHVDRSLALLAEADRQNDPAASERLRSRASEELLLALPIAAQATYHDNQWQALMTTISEIGQVPEETLVPSLSSQCHNIESSVFGQQPPPPSVPSQGGG